MTKQDQQYLYIVQWGKEKSICRFYQKNQDDPSPFLLIDNQQITNYDELGLVIN